MGEKITDESSLKFLKVIGSWGFLKDFSKVLLHYRDREKSMNFLLFLETKPAVKPATRGWEIMC